MGKGHEVHRSFEHGRRDLGRRDVGAEGSALSPLYGNRRPMPTYAAAGSMGRDRPTPLCGSNGARRLRSRRLNRPVAAAGAR